MELVTLLTGQISMKRLHPKTLSSLPSDIVCPSYDREKLRGGIVHLGVGAFQRAHLAVINEAALHRTGDLCWGIVGVSLRRPDTRDALTPQACLYTVSTRETDKNDSPYESLQVIGNIIDILVAPENPAAVLERIAHPDTRIISLTVTEKGYCHDPVNLELNFHHPDITHDLKYADMPRSAIGISVYGLALRRSYGQGPLTLMSLDNLPANGNTLQHLVLAFAECIDPDLKDWIALNCTFPNSMVDRIVPQTTDVVRERVASRLGLLDAWPVITEPFIEWAVEDRFVAGRPDWEQGGGRFVTAVEPYEKLKLRMINGTHSTLAYLGLIAGFATVDEIIAQPVLRHYIAALMHEEIEPTLPVIPGLDLTVYRERLLKRYANSALQHSVYQIAMDGSQKLPQRLLDTIRDRICAGESIKRLALAVAAWFNYLRSVDDAGNTFEIQDPLAEKLSELRAQAEQACAGIENKTMSEQRYVESLMGFNQMFDGLSDKPDFVQRVAHYTASLRERGVMATVATEL